MSRERYLFDTNPFIAAKNTFYSFDIAPTFWIKLGELAEQGMFSIIDRVYDELVFPNKKEPEKEDELSIWIRTEYKGEVHTTTRDKQVVEMYAQIIQKMTQEAPYKSHYRTSAKAIFARASNADAWLVAYAKIFDYTIVTFETYEPKNKRNIKIPVVCKEFGVDCINLYEFLRRMEIKL